MIPGPTLVRACPECKALAKHETTQSGNTFGAKWWTDGAMDAPMLPFMPAIAICGKCQKVAWAEAFEVIDEYNHYFDCVTPFERKKILEKYNIRLDRYLSWGREKTSEEIEDAFEKEQRYRQVPPISEPTASQIIDFVNSSPLSTDQELHARIRAWHLWNNPRRIAAYHEPLSHDELENLVCIAALLEPINNMALILAEAYRESGDFENARNAIARANACQVDHGRIPFISMLVEMRDVQVKRFPD